MFTITLYGLSNEESLIAEFADFCEKIISDILLHQNFSYQDYKSYSLIENLPKEKRIKFINLISKSKHTNCIDSAVNLFIKIFEHLSIAKVDNIMYIADMCYVKIKDNNNNYVIQIKRKECQKKN